MTPRQRIRAVLRGEPADQVPLSIYWLMLPRGERERRLREAGLAIVHRITLFWEERPHCDLIQREYRDAHGVRTIHEVLRTPVGEVTSLRKVGLAYNSEMRVEHFIKTRDDYRVLEYAVRDTRYHPAYEAYHVLDAQLGEDGYVLPHIGYSPLMYMQVELLGIEQFSMHLADHADAFFSLYDLLCERHREVYRIYAASPAETVLYCGNIVPNVIGPRRFERYILPCLDDCAEHLHAQGKLLGSHLDSDNLALAPAVARSKLDFVEAFTPPPDCDMSVAQALAAWPGKAVWCNFPSSVHLADSHTIAETTQALLEQAGTDRRFLLGVTEDIPEAHLWRSLEVIAGVLNRAGR